MDKTGTLVISLDFELHWGMFDLVQIEDYADELLGVRESLPKVLDLFDAYGVHATWATVGLLFFDSYESLIDGLPKVRPTYDKGALSAYNYIENNSIGKSEKDDLYHYAPSLIDLIRSYPNQEIGTHTFSHYYCLEPGQTVEAFREDLKRCKEIAEAQGIDLKSLVFPRNQCNDEYLAICKEVGLESYRGTEDSWLYEAKGENDEYFLRRLIRFSDAYLNIASHHSYPWDSIEPSLPINIPSSRFLRGHSTKLKFLEPLRLRRIIRDVRYAAENNHIYHLWWHPQDFGRNIEANLFFLEEVLKTFKSMQEKHGMQSYTMREIADIVKQSAND